ncbi:MAG: hypothetical protein HW380_1999 [Magnetococcales bacterium]|nr:hypothetical protein [Magnetococcales bacterium]HIJ85881.1 hypothetical protein [Magnetococcales bacterium]
MIPPLTPAIISTLKKRGTEWLHWEGVLVRKADVVIARNYLHEDELCALNNLAEQYLIFAESQAARRIPMTMGDWIRKLEGFLTLR